MDKRTQYSPEVRERTVRLVREHTPEHGSQWVVTGDLSTAQFVAVMVCEPWSVVVVEHSLALSRTTWKLLVQATPHRRTLDESGSLGVWPLW